MAGLCSACEWSNRAISRSECRGRGREEKAKTERIVREQDKERKKEKCKKASKKKGITRKPRKKIQIKYIKMKRRNV
jgi:hypothetical protein